MHVFGPFSHTPRADTIIRYYLLAWAGSRPRPLRLPYYHGGTTDGTHADPGIMCPSSQAYRPRPTGARRPLTRANSADSSSSNTLGTLGAAYGGLYRCMGDDGCWAAALCTLIPIILHTPTRAVFFFLRPRLRQHGIGFLCVCVCILYAVHHTAHIARKRIVIQSMYM